MASLRPTYGTSYALVGTFYLPYFIPRAHPSSAHSSFSHGRLEKAMSLLGGRMYPRGHLLS